MIYSIIHINLRALSSLYNTAKQLKLFMHGEYVTSNYLNGSICLSFYSLHCTKL